MKYGEESKRIHDDIDLNMNEDDLGKFGEVCRQLGFDFHDNRMNSPRVLQNGIPHGDHEVVAEIPGIRIVGILITGQRIGLQCAFFPHGLGIFFGNGFSAGGKCSAHHQADCQNRQHSFLHTKPSFIEFRGVPHK